MDALALTSPKTTSVDELLSATPYPERDYIVRISTNQETKSTSMQLYSTGVVAARLNNYAAAMTRDINLLKSVIHWQHRRLDYGSIYNAYLMDQITEEEFETAVEQFAYEPQNVDPDVLAADASRVFELTEIPYEPSDLADLFQCEHANMMEAVKMVSAAHQEYAKMLPSGD